MIKPSKIKRKPASSIEGGILWEVDAKKEHLLYLLQNPQTLCCSSLSGHGTIQEGRMKYDYNAFSGPQGSIGETTFQMAGCRVIWR